MKLIVKQPKPRNPLVPAAKMRQAGAHGSHERTRRQRREQKRELRRMLEEKH